MAFLAGKSGKGKETEKSLRKPKHQCYHWPLLGRSYAKENMSKNTVFLPRFIFICFCCLLFRLLMLLRSVLLLLFFQAWMLSLQYNWIMPFD